MAPPVRPRNAAARAARFAAAQEQLTPEQLEAQKRSNEHFSQSRIALSSIANIKAAKRWFLEFMGDQHADINVEALYLQPGSPLPPMPLLKEYLRYLVRSRIGNLSDKLSTRTLLVYASNHFTMLGRETQQMTNWPSVKGEIRNFILNNLVVDEGAHTVAYVKEMVNSEDLTYLTKRMYEREFVASFPNMRLFLNLNLYICLMTDCCERGGAIVRGNYSTEEMCLKWEDVSFYTHQSEDETEPTFDIAANVTIKWSKGQKLKEGEWRTIPLPSLLPVSMAPEDTLRLLLTAAMLDGVIDGAESWGDLGKIRAPPNEAGTGRRIRMVEEKKKLPVLRYADRNHNVTEKPEYLGHMTSALKQLGVYAGLQGRLVGYCLRRGVANKLEAEVSDENRRFLMGHRTNSTIFSAYHSRISTVDSVRTLRDMPEEEKVSRNSSILLNRVDGAPRELSDAGMAAVYADTDLRELEARVKALREEILARHPSLVSASRTQEPLFDEYRKVESERRKLLQRLRRYEFQREYAAAFQDVRPQTVTNPEEVEINEMQELSPALGAEDTPDPVDAAGPSEIEEVDQTLDWSVIDPQLWQEAEDLEKARDEEMAGAEDGEDGALEDVTDDKGPTEDTTGPVDDQVPPADKDITTEAPSMRLHQLVEDHIGGVRVGKEDGGQGQRRLIPRSLLATVSVSAYNDLGGELERVQTSEEEASRVLLRYFGVMHSTQEFPAGFEPKVGTYDCRFCGKSLVEVPHTWRHIWACSKDNAAQRSKDHFDNMMRDQSCGWKTATATGGIRECEFGGPREIPYSSSDWNKHVKKHLASVKEGSCYFGDCASLDQDGELHGVTFDSAESLQAHINNTHSIWFAPSCGTAPNFCAYCHTWVDAIEYGPHIAGHLADAQANVARFGYTGFAVRTKIIIPTICPFHFHDETLPAADRMLQITEAQFAQHILDCHIKELQKEEGSLMVCPSYPSMCTKADAMDAGQLTQHLIMVHGIRKLAGKSPRTKTKRKQETNDRQPLAEIEGNSKQKRKKNTKE